MLAEILSGIQEKNAKIIAIDGRCAAGKTTLAKKLQNVLSCNLIHMDDFFLQPEQRTEERLKEPGGNIDYERFLQEALLPLQGNKPFSYRPYDCHRQCYKEPIHLLPDRITVIEGAYSCSPKFQRFYDLRIFLDIDAETQRKRIKERNGAMADVFRDKWIPLEEQYFQAFDVQKSCELSFLAAVH